MASLGWIMPILIGWILLYGQVYFHLWNTLWQTEEYSYAPLIGLMSCILFYLKSKQTKLSTTPVYVAGSLLIVLGMLFAILGFAYNIPLIAMLSQPITLTGIILFIKGKDTLRYYAFPVAFLLFMVPIPGFILETFTYVLKEYLSSLTVALLYHVGYPIANSGVIIQIGHYQLQVADACSGLHSLISLTALGLVYLYLHPTTRLLNLIMLSLIFPIALAGNLIRIILITLITYHFGDITGNMLHDYMGFILFILTGGLLVAIQQGLNYLVRMKGIAA